MAPDQDNVMPKPELPPSLRPPTEATDRQVAAYMVELCEELRTAIQDPRFRPEGQDTATFDRMIEEIQAEARQHAEAAEPSGD